MFSYRLIRLCFMLLISMSMLPSAPAAPLQLPIHLTNQSINEMVREYVFTGKNHTVRVGDDGSGCRFLQLSDPVTDTHKGLVRVRAKANLRVGSRLGSRCIIALNWHGRAQILEKIVATGIKNVLQGQLVDAQLFTNEGREDVVANTAWQWAKPYIPKAFESMKIDLRPPVDQIKAVLVQVLTRQKQVDMEQLVNSLTIATHRVRDNGVDVMLNMELPDTRHLKPSAGHQAALSQDELARLETRFDSLDAFMTSVIKTVGSQLEDEQIKAGLFDVLVDMRYTIRDALVDKNLASPPDPVRQLFTASWRRLSPMVRRIAEGQQGAIALQYLSFISAADALQTLDTLGPAFGLDISTDGLRRLARILIPDSKVDPTHYDESLDPQLRKLFHIHTDNQLPQNKPTGYLDWMISSAWAMDKPDDTLLKLINTTLPNKDNLDDYVKNVDLVLHYAIDEQLKTGAIEQEYEQVFQNAVYTAAWQESCWRQYIRAKGKRKPLQSGTGDMGIMQVNARVWRGFYDLKSLRWDILYNTRAGSEILSRYMQKYALPKKEYQQPGGVDNLARSMYSAYNGGPRQYARYRKKHVPKRWKKIDQLYYDKYLTVKQGNRLAVRSCIIGP